MIKSALQFIAYSNIWIAAGASSFAYFFYVLRNWSVNYQLIGFIFFSTILTYNFQRYVKLKSNERIGGPRMEWMSNHQPLVYSLMAISILGTIYFSLQLNPSSLFVLPILGTVSFLYAFKIKFISKAPTNLRDIPAIKILLIGIVWAGVCVLLPYIEFDNFQEPIIASFFGFVLFIIAITIPFDIRDLCVDEKNKFTIPQIAGEKGSKLIAILLLVVSFYLIQKETELASITIVPGYLASAIFITISNQKKPELFFSIGVDGLLILVPLTAYLLNSL